MMKKLLVLGLAALMAAGCAWAQTTYFSPLKVEREYTGVNYLQDADLAASIGLKKTYTGKGVLFVVIDKDMEINNVAFRDPATGKTRIKYVYANDKLYTDPEEIAKLELNSFLHGTACLGIGAGSYDGVGDHAGMRGVATGSDLMYCNVVEHNDMEKCINAIKQVADSLNVPCVVSVSMGSEALVHSYKGNNSWAKAFNSFTDEGNTPGRILFVSTGNKGNADGTDVYKHVFTDKGEKQYAFIDDGDSKLGDMEFFTSDSKKLKVVVEGYDTVAHKVVDNAFKEEGSEHWLTNEEITAMVEESTDLFGAQKLSISLFWDEALDNAVIRCTITGEEGADVFVYKNLLQVQNEDCASINTKLQRAGLNPYLVSPSVISVGNMSAKDYQSIRLKVGQG